MNEIAPKKKCLSLLGNFEDGLWINLENGPDFQNPKFRTLFRRQKNFWKSKIEMSEKSFSIVSEGIV